MTHTDKPHAPDAWAFTDAEGRIESASRGIGQMLGVGGLLRGDYLLDVLPLPRKALQFDIDTALKGWPTVRTMAIGAPGLERTVRYRVCRALQELGSGLFWRLEDLSSAGLV